MADPHWRARLTEIQDQLLVAHDVDAVIQALLKLTPLLADEWGRPHTDPDVRQLLLDGLQFIKDPEWTKRARKVLQEG